MIRDIVASIFILFSGNSYSQPANTTIDYGGSIFERITTFNMLKDTGVTIKIEGVCISACTMYLGLPDVCVQDGALFGFHSSFEMDQNGGMKKSDFGNQVLMEFYPDAVKKYVVENKLLDTINLTLVNAKTLWSLGIRKCTK